jgi:hypothetical protein
MAKKDKKNRVIIWIDEHLLIVLAGFLLAFIPLYPKLPLFDAIPGYIVRVRLEDFLILVTGVVWFVQVLRKKAAWKNPLSYMVVAYILVGLLSTLSAMFITKTVPLEPLHIGKMYLHYFRRIEYFALLFIVFSAVKTKDQAKKLIKIAASTLIGVSLYGYGQKYFYLPVYSTMNREFAKGLKLVLTEGARVPSTFGGHYDLAAYTSVMLVVVLALYFLSKKGWLKLLFGVGFLTGFWLLILTASRTSFISYLLAITALMFTFLFVKGWKWAMPRWFGVVVFSLFVMIMFGDLNQRFIDVLGLTEFQKKYSSLAFLPKIGRPSESISVDEVTVTTIPNVVYEGGVGGGVGLPPDAIEEAEVQINTEGGTRVVSRTYSENAYKYGLSMAIRFDTLWPRAIEGFKRNPLLGSGYSTLTKETIGQFTEAESTDNNYLRELGETGLLGFLTFYGVVVSTIYLGLKNLKYLKKDPLFLAFGVGMIAGTLGLLLNAIFIDVFAASKVAESYWALVGLLMAVIYVTKERVKINK